MYVKTISTSESFVISKIVEDSKSKKVVYAIINKRKNISNDDVIFNICQGYGIADEPYKSEDPHSQNHKCEGTSSIDLTKEEMREYIINLRELINK